MEVVTCSQVHRFGSLRSASLGLHSSSVQPLLRSWCPGLSSPSVLSTTCCSSCRCQNGAGISSVAVIFVGAAGASYRDPCSIMNVITHYNEGKGCDTRPSAPRSEVLFQLLPMAQLLGSVAVWAVFSPSSILTTAPIALYGAGGFLFCYLVVRFCVRR